MLRMNLHIRAVLLCLLFMTGFGLLAHAESDTLSVTKVYTFGIKEMIAPPVWRTTQLAMEAAVEAESDLVLIHMNT